MSIINKIFSREKHTCPWWLCFTFDNPVREIFHNPFKILGSYVKADDKILDIGPGMGYFTFPLSKMTGERGKVIALDIQAGMLKILDKKIKAKKAGNIDVRLYDGVKFNINEKFDFILLFWMFHEVRNKNVFIKELGSVLKPNGKILISEPRIHVSEKSFYESIALLTDYGFKIVEEPKIALSRAVIMQK